MIKLFKSLSLPKEIDEENKSETIEQKTEKQDTGRTLITTNNKAGPDGTFFVYFDSQFYQIKNASGELSKLDWYQPRIHKIEFKHSQPVIKMWWFYQDSQKLIGIILDERGTIKFCFLRFIYLGTFTWIHQPEDQNKFEKVFQKDSLLSYDLLKTSISNIDVYQKSDNEFDIIITGENSVMIFYTFKIKFEENSPPKYNELTSIKSLLSSYPSQPVQVYKSITIESEKAIILLWRKSIIVHKEITSGKSKNSKECKYYLLSYNIT